MADTAEATAPIQRGSLVDNSNSGVADPSAFERGLQEEKSPKIPDKFQGKSVEDIVRSYTELEQTYGKQAQELGELRKLTDAYIKSQLEANSTKEGETNQRVKTNELEGEVSDPSVTGEEADDPAYAKAREILEKEIAPFKQELTELKKEKFVNKLSSQHRDFEQIVQDKNFQDWVIESPMRVELFKRADLQFDFDSANELFNIWKEKQGVVKDKETKAEMNKATESAFNDARMETSSVDETPPKKKYRRVDIVELMRSNPERYRALEPEIRRAYAEGRVI